MTPEEKQQLDNLLKEQTKHERDFLEYGGLTPNQHGVYLYISQDGNSQLSLDLFLHSYRTWLVENDILRER